MMIRIWMISMITLQMNMENIRDYKNMSKINHPLTQKRNLLSVH